MKDLTTLLVYWAGKPRFMRSFRRWYWRTHGGVWFWGIQGFVRDMAKAHACKTMQLTMSPEDYFLPIRSEEGDE